ncbi:MAG: cupredoxin domain-containing protein [Bdellovibrionales bacterium]
MDFEAKGYTMRMRIFGLAIFAAALMVAPFTLRAADMPEHKISIKDKRFAPAELTIPANTKVKLVIKNEDAQAAEFESDEMHREKVVPAHEEVSVYVGPLKPGTYSFYNDFDPSKTAGKITVQ